ncbi:MAG TPA: RNB domain-containing ribonuclease [Vicinamibacterales bacterium]|nr:RNB domain-containing ribonuclease [Vicinamibacterales bacterium]
MTTDGTLLRQIARRAMIARGLEPDFPPGVEAAAAAMRPADAPDIQDLTGLPWSSIDNDDSKDLDQAEVVLTQGTRFRVLVAIADVAELVPRGSAIDDHAAANTTSVYTPAEIFPMLPPELSTGTTSLNDQAERDAIVIELGIDANGVSLSESVYRARVKNQAKLAYDSVAAWLGGGPAPDPLRRPEIAEQLRLQDRIATILQSRRDAEGALEFDRAELTPVMDGDRVADLDTVRTNRAREIIENFMVAANGVTARFLAARKVPSLRRVVRAPERWARIVALAAQHGARLPSDPDAAALSNFLRQQKASSPAQFPDISLAVLKLLGRGEYVASAPGAPSEHFALAVSSYTHSTAPNRRFPDLVAQRQIRAALAGEPPPYDLAVLTSLAAHCTQREDDANRIERLVKKAAAALLLRSRIGETFDGVITGASPKGTWVRISHPAVEGRVERGEQGLDVGDRVRVRLIATNPEKGFIDFSAER